MIRRSYHAGYDKLAEGSIAASALDKLTAFSIMFPFIVGAVPTAAAVMATSPSKKDFENLQEKIYNQELREMVSVIKRRQGLVDKKREKEENEREIHF